ncbi:glycosyltransferase family 52 [Vibrio coralliirubri]|uniref:glycosyltransferase family 52 n=1 Tax=Vibrio coralliirubri TaxID=1516159 RepID=UPI002FE0BD36
MSNLTRYEKLSICRTKLQVYTFCLLLSQKKTNSNFIFFIDDNYNEANLQFLKRISDNTNVKYTYYVKKNVISDLIVLLGFVNKYSCCEIYISSVGNGYISLMLGVLKYDSLITFDDGAANLEKSSFVYIQRNSFARKLFFMVFYKSKSLKQIVESSSIHFNIFPDFLYPVKGYFNNEVNINLLFKSSNVGVKLGDFDCVFVAPCYEEYFNDPLEAYRKVILFLNDKIREGFRLLYVSHPRSSFEIPQGLTPDKSLNEYLLEELIPSLYKEEKPLELIGFGNTTQAFFLSDDKVNITILSSVEVKEMYVNHFFSCYSGINRVALD